MEKIRIGVIGIGDISDVYLNNLKKYDNKATIMLSSSVQATLAGRFGNSEYGRSKKAAWDPARVCLGRRGDRRPGGRPRSEPDHAAGAL